ncbi:hypothetical protein [Marmoricola sp. Leaf446]|uniref:hypothetical protein n=1 Tax=Marmoricola sp. Leaf446 TaxID=1736379 RepID=UPI0012E39020|nr:hypothetical protein [Marmoricola sp. Leaf446]
MSPLGAGLGVVAASAPYALGVQEPLAWVLVGSAPLVGVLLVLLPGRARHLGTGLVASALTLPLLLLALLVVGAVA